MSSAEAYKLKKRVEDNGLLHDKSQQIVAAYVLEFDPISDEPDAARTHFLANRFEELVAFSELTTGNMTDQAEHQVTAEVQSDET